MTEYGMNNLCLSINMKHNQKNIYICNNSVKAVYRTKPITHNNIKKKRRRQHGIFENRLNMCLCLHNRNQNNVECIIDCENNKMIEEQHSIKGEKCNANR